MNKNSLRDDFDERICRLSARADGGSSSIRVEYCCFCGNFIVESVFHKPPKVPERVFRVFKRITRDKKHRRVTQMCSLEFKTELDRFDANMERWRETYEMYEDAMWEANGNGSVGRFRG